jgi:hypothetical protein
MLLALCVEPAYATGGFDCSVDDTNLTFEAASPLGRGMGSPILDLKTSLKIKMKDTPTDLATPDFKDALVHSWMAGDDLRLHYYREREGNVPHGYVELVIKTVLTAEEVETTGTYELEVFSTDNGGEGRSLKATGPITCSVE